MSEFPFFWPKAYTCLSQSSVKGNLHIGIIGIILISLFLEKARKGFKGSPSLPVFMTVLKPLLTQFEIDHTEIGEFWGKDLRQGSSKFALKLLYLKCSGHTSH